MPEPETMTYLLAGIQYSLTDIILLFVGIGIAIAMSSRSPHVSRRRRDNEIHR